MQRSDGGTESDVTVYRHVDKEGIWSEVVTAKTTNGLYEYLKNKGLNIEIGSIPVLDNYIGKDYSFVVSWLSSPKKVLSSEDIRANLSTCFLNGYRDQPRYPKFLNLVNTLKQKYPELDRKPDLVDFLWSERGADILQELTQTIQNDSSIIADVFESQTSRTSQKGVYVTFPTDKIYFPLLPTSVYGDEIVPATIWIEGHVSPEIFRDIASYTKTEYYVAIPSVSVYFEGLENFYGGENQNEKYKKLKSMRRQSF